MLVVLHIGANESFLPELLGAAATLPVEEGTRGELRRGQIYVAPPDKHMLVSRDGLVLSDGPKENFTRPASIRCFDRLPSITVPGQPPWC